MDFFLDVVINLLAHRIGAFVLKILTGGRLRGVSGFEWGLAVSLGGLLLLAPLATAIAWLIYLNDG